MTIAISGTDVYRDAAGTAPVADGETLVPGDQLWAEYDAQTTGQGFTLATTATVRAGNVYLYDGHNPPRTSAQALILAAETLVPIRAAATIVHPDVATLQVDVVLAGAAAGEQGAIQITATCTTALVPTPIVVVRHVPASTPAGTVSFLIPNIPDDTTTCSVVQDTDGATATVQVATTILPPSVVLSGAAPQVITVTDTYTRIPGDFRVDLAVTGTAAGLQGAVDLLASCDTGSGVVSQTFTVAAGATGTTTAGTLTALANGTTCTVTVTATGDDPAAELVASSIAPAVATVPAGGTAVTTVTNEYDAPAPTTGRFAVDVTVAGAAAGLQGSISVLAACDSGGSTAFSLPAGATAGTYRVGTVAGIPVGAVCDVTQTADGTTAEAQLTGTTIVPASVTISDTVLEVITVTDTYAVPVPPAGSFRVDVSIGGVAAGAQAGITVVATCGSAPDQLTETFALAAALGAGTHTAGTIPDVPVGYVCAATLLVDGHTADAVLASSSITPASVTIALAVESTVTVALAYSAPVPTPTPTPAPMPATGAAGGPPWWLVAVLLGAGALLTSLVLVLRRRAA